MFVPEGVVASTIRLTSQIEMIYVLFSTEEKKWQHMFVDSTSQQPVVTVYVCMRTHKLEVSLSMNNSYSFKQT